MEEPMMGAISVGLIACGKGEKNNKKKLITGRGPSERAAEQRMTAGCLLCVKGGELGSISIFFDRPTVACIFSARSGLPNSRRTESTMKKEERSLTRQHVERRRVMKRPCVCGFEQANSAALRESTFPDHQSQIVWIDAWVS